MILRKPYAFLIRHFRLIHLIITGILVYLVSIGNKLYTFVISCIDDPVNRYNALQYIDYSVYIYILIAMGLFFAIYWLFRYKDKPRGLYVVSIIGYLITGIYLFVLFSYFTGLPIGVIDPKAIRAYRDIMLMVLGFQYVIILIMFIRGLGFDVKKFNFNRDAQELGLTNEDGEEIEVDVNINAASIMRGVRKKKRELGYFFQEYKVFILGILFILLTILGVNGYKYFSKKYKVYNENEVIGHKYLFTVNDSYYDIEDDKSYIIVNFDVFKNGVEDKINVNNLVLMVDNVEYLANKNVCYKYDYLGNCYKKQVVTNKMKNYILVYEVDNLNLERTYFVYKESYDDTFKVGLDLENYD